MTLYKDKYRSESHRRQGWNYRSTGFYFVTICSQDRIHFFGQVENQKMILSDIGLVADQYWRSIPDHFEHVQLHNHVIMPDHMHGIIEITDNLVVVVDPPKLGESTTTTKNTRTAAANAAWKPGILGVIINQYKRICTIHARKINPEFKWQRNYHDHIIRDSQSYHRIARYIDDNPRRWHEDKGVDSKDGV